jgi:diamine N-acetyltransferase
MITGKNVRLRAIEREDIPRFVTWLNDPEVTAGLVMTLPFSLAEEEDWYENMLKRPPAEHPLGIEVFDDGQWVHIGNCGYHEIDWRVRAAELGIMIGEKRYWNRGFGTAVMCLLVDHGFKTLNMNRVMLQVYDTNPRAVRCYEKVGFIHEGRKRQGMYKDGRYCDILIMSILRSEWSQNAGL